MTAIGFRAVRCLWIAGLLLMSAAACFWPLFRHPTNLLVGVHGGESNDLTAQYLPWHEVPRLTLTRHGQLPFWSPWWGAGSPYLGNPQTSVFYPANLLYWVYEPWWLMSWVLIAHHVVAAAGAYGLCRRLGGTAIGAAFASVAYGFSPVLLARTGAGHYAGIGVVAWYPWAFWMYEDFRTGKRWGLPGVVIALSLAFLAGHPQELVYLVVALTATCLCDAGRSLRFEQPSRALKLVLRWLLAGAMTVGLVAAELIPMAVYYSQASREARLAASHEGEPGLANLLQLLHPFALGDPVSYRGPGSHYWETICYFGLVPLTLSILGLISAIRGRLPIWRLAFVGALAFVFSFGALTPVAGLFGTIMSGLPSFRCPGRWLYLTALSVSILSGIGVSAVAEARADRGIRLRRMLPWTVLLLALVGSVTMVAGMIGSAAGGPGSNGRPLPPWEIFTAMIVKPAPCLALASALVCLAAAWSRPRRAALAAALLIPVAVLENAAFANAILTTLSQQTSVLENHPASTFAKGAPGFRVFCQQAVVSDGQAMEDDLLKVQKYEPVPLDRTLRCLSATLNAGTRPPIAYLMGFVPFELGNASSGLLDLWAIRWVITTAADRPPAGSAGWQYAAELETTWSATPRTRPVLRIPCRIWENPHALPRGFVVGQVRVASPGGQEVDALAGIDPRREVLLERDILPTGRRQGFTPARRIEDTPNRVVLEVETKDPGYLVLADTWYPGWTAMVDERPSPVLRANLAFRAVTLPEAGTHRVVFSYYPVGLNAGLAISLATVTMLAGALVWRRPGAR